MKSNLKNIRDGTMYITNIIYCGGANWLKVIFPRIVTVVVAISVVVQTRLSLFFFV